MLTRTNEQEIRKAQIVFEHMCFLYFIQVVNEGSLLKKTKLRFFNKFTLNQLVNLLDYSNEDDDDDGRADSIKQIANKMLLTLCADEKLGICFPNKLGAFASR